MSKSSNAITAKARAMLAEHLKPVDYATMLQKKTVGDIAIFLQSQPLYKESLEGINPKSIHRGQLEVLLRTGVFNRFAKLIRYADDNAKHFGHIAVMETEIELILMKLHSLSDQDNEILRQNMISKLPLYIGSYTSFPLEELADSASFQDVLALLKDTSYYDVLKKYEQKSLEDMDFINLEHSLRTRYYATCLETIEKYSNTTSKEKMKEIILSRIELENIAIIYRLKKYFTVSKEFIKQMLADYCCFFRMKDLYDMVDNDTAEQVIQRLEKSRYKAYLSNQKFLYIEHYAQRITFNMSAHFVRTDTDPNLSLLAYVLLADIEIQNVIDIIESVRYQIPQERVKALLIY